MSTQNTESNGGFFDSALWKGLKDGKLGEVGAAVSFDDNSLLKLGASIFFAAALIILFYFIIKKAAK